MSSIDNTHFQTQTTYQEQHLYYLLKLIESYYTTIRIPSTDINDNVESNNHIPQALTFILLIRMREIRQRIANLLTIKKYPFNKGYRQHQQVFIAIWLAILPLSMTALPSRP